MGSLRDFYTKTTYMLSYPDHGKVKTRRILYSKEEDPLLINGKFVNNLKIYEDLTSSHLNENSEEYSEFVKQIDDLSPTLNEKYFENQKLDKEHINEMYRDLVRSCYLIDYCPYETDITTQNLYGMEKHRMKINTDVFPTPNTTYQASYRDIKKCLSEIGIKVLPLPSFNENNNTDAIMGKFSKTGKTVYQSEICEIAERNMKRLIAEKKLPIGPIDQYTKF